MQTPGNFPGVLFDKRSIGKEHMKINGAGIL